MAAMSSYSRGHLPYNADGFGIRFDLDDPSEVIVLAFSLVGLGSLGPDLPLHVDCIRDEPEEGLVGLQNAHELAL